MFMILLIYEREVIKVNMEQIETWVRVIAWTIGAISGLYSIAKIRSELKEKKRIAKEEKRKEQEEKKTSDALPPRSKRRK